MKLQKTIQKSIVGLVASIALLVGAPSVSSLKLTGRTPASVSVLPAKSMEVLDFNCNTSKLQASAQQVRLRGSLCRGFDLSQFKKLGVKNQNSGDSASVFKLDSDHITTDYIQLSSGENKISFNQGNEKFEITIVR